MNLGGTATLATEAGLGGSRRAAPATADLSRGRYLLLVLALGLLHALLAAVVPLSGDEAYYWDCSRHLDWSYFDQPPLVIWAMIPFRALLGESAFAVRAPAILASAVLALLLVPLVRRLGGSRRDAARAYLLLHALPLYFLGSFYASTDAVMATAYAGAVLAAVAIAQGERRAWWGFGLACGLGFLAKFPVVLAAAAFVPALRQPRVRAQLRGPVPYLAALVSLAITAPVWIWGALHGWDNLRFQLADRHAGVGFGWRHLGDFLAANLLLATPFLLVAMGLALWARRRRGPAWAVLTFGALAPFAFFGAVAFRAPAGAHWGAPGLVLGVVAVALVPFPGRRLLVAAAAVVGPLLALLAAAVATFPEAFLSLEGRLPGGSFLAQQVERQPKLFGWEEAGSAIERLRREGELVASQSYSTVHRLAFDSGGRLPTRLANVNQGIHGKASLYWHPPADLAGRDVLFVSDRGPFLAELSALFESTEELPPIEISRAGTLVRRLYLVRCRNLLHPMPAFSRLNAVDDNSIAAARVGFDTSH